jgi:hypothetical protein
MKNLVREHLHEGIFDKFKKGKPEIEPNLPIEDFGGQEHKKIVPKEGYDLDRFYKTIETLRNREQYARKRQLTNLFFRNFIGKELLDSVITDFNADVESGHYYGLSVNLEDGSRLDYVFNRRNEDDNYEKATIRNSLKHERYKNMTHIERGEVKNEVSRKDARLIGSIARKFNPNTKYAKGTGDLKIKEY